MKIFTFDIFVTSDACLCRFCHVYLRSKIGIYKDQRSAQIEQK